MLKTKFYVFVVMISFLIMTTNISSQEKTPELTYRIVDTIVSSVSNEDYIFYNYTNENSWFFVDNPTNISITEVDLKTKKRDKYSFNIQPNNRNYLMTIYGDKEYLVAVMSQECHIYQKESNSKKTIKYDKNEDYRIGSIHHDTLTLAGVYNYHIKDGYPMLQVAQYQISTGKKISQKRYSFPGIFYTTMISEFISIHNNHVYFLKPLSNYYYRITSDLKNIDSFIIDPIVTTKTNIHPDIQTMDSINEINVGHKQKNKKQCINNEWHKEVIYKIKEFDTMIYRNEKIYVNDSYIFITRKPFAYKGWEKREIFIIEKSTGKMQKYLSQLDRKKDVYKPDFVSSTKATVTKDLKYYQVKGDHFYNPEILTKEDHDTALEKWAIENDTYYFMLKIYQLNEN